MMVGSLSVVLGLLVNKKEWAEGQAHVNHFRRVALGIGAIFGGRFIGKALIGFNQNVENAKNQVASMLALGGQTTLESQLTRASDLYDMLRKKAATLPGETEDYVNMLGLIAQPMAAANLSLEQMRDITSGSFVFAKGMGISWQEAARDIRDFINSGKITARDKFLNGIMVGTGVQGDDAGRAKAKAMGVKGRAALMYKQTNSPLAQEVATRLGSSFEGRFETVKDSIKQAMGAVGKGLFESLKVTMDKMASWFTDNQDAIQAWATSVGGYITTAFEALQDGFSWLLDHEEVLVSFFVVLGALFTQMAIRALIAWAAVAWPAFAGAAIFLMLWKLYDKLGLIPTVLITIAAAAALMWVGLLGPIAVFALLVAGIVAILYKYGDDIMAFFGKVKDFIVGIVETAKDALDTLFGSSSFDKAFAAAGVDLKTGKLLDQPVQTADGLATSMVGQPTRELTPLEKANQLTGTQSATVNQTNNITIQTQDADGAKKAFDNSSLEFGAAAMRKAYENSGGT